MKASSNSTNLLPRRPSRRFSRKCELHTPVSRAGSTAWTIPSPPSVTYIIWRIRCNKRVTCLCGAMLCLTAWPVLLCGQLVSGTLISPPFFKKQSLARYDSLSHTHTYTHADTQTRRQTNTHQHTRTHIHDTHTHTQTRTHTHTHHSTHTHTHKYK